MQSQTYKEAGLAIVRFAVAFAILATVLISVIAPGLLSQSPVRTKVAEGEYLTYTYSPADTNERLRESWVLWRVSDGKYAVESELRFENTTAKTAFRQSVFLSSDLRPERIKTLSLAPPNNETDIQLMRDEVRVKDMDGESNLKISSPYDLYYPLTPWPLSSFARRVGAKKSIGMPVIFVAVDEVGPQQPLGLTMLWARDQCLGSEELTLAGQKFIATKYLIRLGPYPGVFVWLSDEGLVLATQNEENLVQKTELVSFRKYEELPKLLIHSKSIN